MAGDEKDPNNQSNNEIARAFGEARRTFSELHRQEVDRANYAQQRARMFRYLAEESGIMERFYSDDTVN